MNWPEFAFGDVAEVVTGSTPSKKKAVYFGEDIPFITPAELTDGNLGKPKVYLSLEGGKHARILPPDSVLVCCIGSLGKVGFTTEEVATNQQINALIFDQKKVVPRYGFHFCKTLKREMKQLAPSTTVAIINKTRFSEFKIPLPPLDEQKRIAAILDKAYALRQKREKVIALTDDLLRSVFLDMFGAPVTNPNEWECMKLGDLCGVGSSKRVFVSEFVDDGIPFYRGTEVGKLAVGKKITPKLFIAPEHYEDLIQHSGQPEIGDLLLPSICHDGRIWKVDNSKPFYFKDGRVLWIKNNGKKIDSDYLKIHLQYLFLTNYNSIASGTTFAELKIVNLKNLSVLLPPLDLQKQYSKIVEHHSKSIKRLKGAKHSCDNLFASLTQQAFSGDLTSLKEAA